MLEHNLREMQVTIKRAYTRPGAALRQQTRRNRKAHRLDQRKMNCRSAGCLRSADGPGPGPNDQGQARLVRQQGDFGDELDAGPSPSRAGQVPAADGGSPATAAAMTNSTASSDFAECPLAHCEPSRTVMRGRCEAEPSPSLWHRAVGQALAVGPGGGHLDDWR
jgi:hypothetical protein